MDYELKYKSYDKLKEFKAGIHRIHKKLYSVEKTIRQVRIYNRTNCSKEGIPCWLISSVDWDLWRGVEVG